MPILIKGSGGAQKAPTINVSSSGLITATAGKKSVTKQLSSADCSSFRPYNILKNKTIFGITGTVSQKLFSRLDESDLTGAGSNYFEFKVYTGAKEFSYGHDLLAICMSVKVNTPNNIKCYNLSAWNTNYITTDKGLSLYWVNREEVKYSSTYSSSGDLTKLDDTVRVTCTYDDTDLLNPYVTIRVESSDFGTLGLTNSSNYYIRSLDGFVMLFEDD